MTKEYKRPANLLPMRSGFCPGCLHGLAVKLIAEALEDLGQTENAIHVLPVGCSTLNLLYWKGDMAASAHGRAPAVATGVKRCQPDRLIFTYQGDGDLAAIGLAEIISAANRGENFTVIFANNSSYGMTGGQMAPTTLIGQRSSTTPHGRPVEGTGYPMRMCEMLAALEAPAYVARFALHTPEGAQAAKAGIKKAFELQLAGGGFSFVELLTNCPANWKLSPLASLDYMETHTAAYFKPGVYKEVIE